MKLSHNSNFEWSGLSVCDCPFYEENAVSEALWDYHCRYRVDRRQPGSIARSRIKTSDVLNPFPTSIGCKPGAASRHRDVYCSRCWYIVTEDDEKPEEALMNYEVAGGAFNLLTVMNSVCVVEILNRIWYRVRQNITGKGVSTRRRVQKNRVSPRAATWDRVFCDAVKKWETQIEKAHNNISSSFSCRRIYRVLAHDVNLVLI
jgi:hypothetical protein